MNRNTPLTSDIQQRDSHVRYLGMVSVGLVIALLVQPQWHTVAKIDAKNTEMSAFIQAGQRYEYPSAVIPLYKGDRWVIFDSNIRLVFPRVNQKANYRVKATFLSDSDQRRLRVIAGNTALQELSLPIGKIVEWKGDVPSESFANGSLEIQVQSVAGPNAVLASLTLESTDPHPLKALPSLKERLNEIKFTVPQFTPVPTGVHGIGDPTISLNGRWEFALTDQKKLSVKVPGELRMQGITIPEDGEGTYSRTFTIPSTWKNQSIMLRFDTLFGDATVAINGKIIARHDQTFVPLELDITPNVHVGENTIEVTLKGRSISDVLASASQYAAHPLFGILRKVQLICLPKDHVEELNWSFTTINDYRDGQLVVSGRLASGQKGVTVSCLQSFHGLKAGYTSTKTDSKGRFELKIKVENVWDWTPENPQLYDVNLLVEKNNVQVEYFTRKVGYRTIEVKGNQLLVNGKPVKLRGACRHEVDVHTGRSITPEQCQLDAKLFKQMNCNYIRTSHYPPSEEFLAACDELGLFVECEAPMCWVNHGTNGIWGKWDSRSPELLPYLLYGNLANVQFNRNHPSVLIWSLANESAWSPLWERVNQEVKKLDPSRPTSFHDQCWGDYNSNKSNADIAVFHYPGEDGPAQCDKDSRPVLFGEYCHLECYNRRELETDPGIRDDWGRPFDRMVSLMQKHNGCLGGAIWSGIDDIFRLPEGRFIGYGPWGPIDAYRRAKPEFWHVRKAYSPVRVIEAAKPLTLNRTVNLRIENRFDFTNLDRVVATVYVRNKKIIVPLRGVPRSIQNVTFTLPFDPTPGEKMRITFVLPEQWGYPSRPEKDVLVDEEVLHFAGGLVEGVQPSGPKLTIDETSDKVTVKGKTTTYTIDKTSGMLSETRIGAMSITTSGPTLMVLPLNAESGGAGGNDYRAGIEPFNPTCSNWKVKSVLVDKDKGQVRVEGTYDEAEGSFTLTFREDGYTVDYAFKMRQAINPRQIGVVLDYPRRAFKEMTWKRQGYWTSYPSDHIGRIEGTTSVEPVEGLMYKGPWGMDSTMMGSNDFRSTKANVISSSLIGISDITVAFSGSAPVSTRAWLEGSYIRMLIANFNTGGADPFFGAHYALERRPLKVGDEVKGRVEVRVTEKMRQ